MADDIATALAAAAAGAGEAGVRSPVAHLMNKGQFVEFSSPRGLLGKIRFPAFLTSFTDNVQANFNDKTTYGRMDPIYTYQNTQRVINFAIDIPAVGPNEAKANLSNIKKLQTLLYPTYASNEGDSLIISTAPLFQIKFNNLISDPDAPGGALMGVIPSISYNPGLDSGMFYSKNKFYPKLIQLSVEFKPVHSRVSGFKQGSDNFLRNVPDADVASSTPSREGAYDAASASSGVLDDTDDTLQKQLDNMLRLG
jgi:hypothetical protein